MALATKIPYALADSRLTLPFRQNAAPLLLHFNENSLGMSPKALSAAKRAIELYGNRYADKSFEAFKFKLAAYHQVKSEHLIFGNGSTEVLQAIATYAANINATMIEPNPTFGVKRIL